MSVVISGAFVVQTVPWALIGLLALLLLGALWRGASRRSQRGLTLEQNLLPTRWLEVAARLLSGFTTPTASRAPPTARPGSRLAVPVSTFAYRRRHARSNDRS